MNKLGLVAVIALSCVLGALLVALPPTDAGANAQSAAARSVEAQSAEAQPVDQVLSRYARYGADVWAQNPGALISGEGAACISCHTSLPYALVEPLLPGSYPAYTELINNVNSGLDRKAAGKSVSS